MVSASFIRDIINRISIKFYIGGLHQKLSNEYNLSAYNSIPVAPTWRTEYPWNASIHFSFLI
jgi:hypothetical protein